MPSYVIALKRKRFCEDTEPVKRARQKLDDSSVERLEDDDHNEDKCSSFSTSESSNIGFEKDEHCSDRDGCLSSFSDSPLSIPDFEFRYEACSPIRPVCRSSPSASFQLPTQGGDSNSVPNSLCSAIVPSKSPALPEVIVETDASPMTDVNHSDTNSENNELSSVHSSQSFSSYLSEDSALVMGIVRKIKAEDETAYNPMTGKKSCTVCGADASGMYFGAIVCLPCKSFFIRCTKEGEPTKLKCQNDINCGFPGPIRHRCQYCRFQRCIVAGMCRKEKPEVVEPALGQSLCKVCGDIANGIHFGVNTCEGCKKFFRRGLKEAHTYSCREGQSCPVTPRSRNACRYCRYMKCVSVGMSREAIKMGRPRKSSETDLKDFTAVLNTKKDEVPTVEDLSAMPDRRRGFSHLSRREQEILLKLRLSGYSMPQLNRCHSGSDYEMRRQNLVTSSYESLASNPRNGLKASPIGTGSVPSLSQSSLQGRHSFCKESQPYRDLTYRQSLSAPSGLISDQMNNVNRPDQPYSVQTVKTEMLASPCAFQNNRLRHNLIPSSSHEPQTFRHGSVHGAPRGLDNTLVTPNNSRLRLSDIVSHMPQQPLQQKLVSDMCNDIVDELMQESDVQNAPSGLQNGSFRKSQSCVEDMDFHNGWLSGSHHHANRSAQDVPIHCKSGNKIPFPEPSEDQTKRREINNAVDQFKPNGQLLEANGRCEDILLSNETKKCLATIHASYREMVAKCDESSMSLDLRKNSDQGKIASMGVIRTIQQGIIPNCEAQLWFATRIPGFCNLCRDDQVVLLKYSSFQLGLIWASIRRFDSVLGKFHNFDVVKLPAYHPMEMFQAQLYSLAEKLQAINMDDREASMLSALLLFAGDYLELKETGKIHKQYSMLLKTLDEYVFRKIGKKSNRLHDLVSFIAKLRHLGIWYTHLMKYIDMDARLAEN